MLFFFSSEIANRILLWERKMEHDSMCSMMDSRIHVHETCFEQLSQNKWSKEFMIACFWETIIRLTSQKKENWTFLCNKRYRTLFSLAPRTEKNLQCFPFNNESCACIKYGCSKKYKFVNVAVGAGEREDPSAPLSFCSICVNGIFFNRKYESSVLDALFVIMLHLFLSLSLWRMSGWESHKIITHFTVMMWKLGLVRI